MRIITWNCNMAFRKKAELILSYQPDILIVPECEHPDKLKFRTPVKQPTDMLWYGNNLNKGLAVFSYSTYRFELLEQHNPEIKTILPIKVTGGEFDFLMFAIWAGHGYIRQIWKALRHYEELIGVDKTILIGDFNSNKIWDYKHGGITHSGMVEHLKLKGISSTYHDYYGLSQGKEQHPTLAMFRHKDKPYHIDYCFASSDFADRLDSVEVGVYEDWTALSDHYLDIPLILTT